MVYKMLMENNTKSKITVIGFIVFILVTYAGSYFYTKNNNERLLSAPRLVLLIGSEEQVNREFEKLTAEQRREEIRTMYSLGRVFSISQELFDAGSTDIAHLYNEQVAGYDHSVHDCMDYSETLKRTMVATDKAKLKQAWVFYACGIIE